MHDLEIQDEIKYLMLLLWGTSHEVIGPDAIIIYLGLDILE